MNAPTTRKTPARSHLTFAFLLTICGTALLWYLFGARWVWSAWLVGWLVAINLIAILYYGYDKAQAGQGGARIPEKVLHALSLAGGSPGAFLAMQFFRHKTIKGRFRILFWCIVALQTVLAVWLVWFI